MKEYRMVKADGVKAVEIKFIEELPEWLNLDECQQSADELAEILFRVLPEAIFDRLVTSMSCKLWLAPEKIISASNQRISKFKRFN